MEDKPDYEKELRKSGLRITRQRRIILGLLNNNLDHPNAFELFKRASEKDPTISLSTVYRTMKALEEVGAIERHPVLNRKIASITTTSLISTPAMLLNSAPTSLKNCKKKLPIH